MWEWQRSALLALCCVAVVPALGQLSSPIASDNHVSVDGNRFLARQPRSRGGWKQQATDEAKPKTCPQNVQLKWMAETSSSVYSTPLITDLFSDGVKDIIVPSFVHFLEVLQADDGAQAAGFPAFHASKVHASPLMYDVDQDGIQDIVVATYDGEIFFFKDNGEQISTKLTIPRLTVKKDWYSKLTGAVGVPRGVNATLPDPHQKVIELEEFQQHVKDVHEQVVASRSQPPGAGSSPQTATQQGMGPAQQAAQAGFENTATGRQQFNPQEMQQHSEFAAQHRDMYADTNVHEVGSDTRGTNANPDQQPTARRRLLQDAAAGGNAGGTVPAASTTTHGSDATQGATPHTAQDGAGAAGADTVIPTANPDPDGELSDEAAHALDIDEFDDDDDLYEPKDWNNSGDFDYAHHYHHQFDDDFDAAANNNHLLGDEHLRDEPHDASTYDEWGHHGGDYDPFDAQAYTDHHDDPDWGWADDEFNGAEPHPNGVVYLDVDIDPHIMCTPAIGDIDKDDHQELIVAVSYLFDQSFYDDPSHMNDLDPSIDRSMYVASGIVAFDLVTHHVKWSRHLDLSTDHVSFRAYMYSTPTLADLDQNGKLSIIVGTSVGLLYVLNPDGTPRSGFPVQMGEIQAQVAVADVNGDGYLELLAADTRGSVAMFDRFGKLLWDHFLDYSVSQVGTFGDVNGDGKLDVAIGTGGGQLWALDAATGRPLPGFPYNTTGRIVAPVLITRLMDGPSQQLVVMCFDGFLYIVDGITGCADVIDIGEASYAMVLTDDLDSNGRMDLLVSTMNGHIYAFETPSEYHPLKTWTKQPEGSAGFVARHDWVGIYATELTRRPIDIRGTSFPVEFRIMDKAPTAGELQGKAPADGAASVEVKRLGSPYSVKVLLQGISAEAMNYGNQPVIIGMSDTFHAPGKYTLEIPCPRSRSTATIHLEMTDVNGITYVDTFAQSFHMHFYRLLKWMIAGPLLAMGLFVLVLKPEDAVVLPS